MYTVLSYIRPFEGNLKADVAPGENEFDTPGVEVRLIAGRMGSERSRKK